MDSQIFGNQQTIIQPKLSKDLMKVSEHQLGTKFRSKHDLYQYMTEILHKYLPPKDSINKEFIKQILKNEKEVFDMKDVKQIKVPKYDELSVRNLYPQVYADDIAKKYLPDQGSKNKPLDRKFFFDIVNTIYPDFLSQLIEHASNLRNKPEDNEEKKEYILMSDKCEFMLTIEKPGRTIQLLKESSKMYKGRKSKDQKQIGISLKRFKGMENIQEQRNELSDVNNEMFQQIENIISTNENSSEKNRRKKRFNI